VPQNERLIDDLADAILDASPVDWAAAESSSDETAQLVVRQLRVLAAVADLHRVDPKVADAPGMWSHLRLVERIGRGAFGEVYRAWDTRLDREVALKLLPADRSPGIGQRLQSSTKGDCSPKCDIPTSSASTAQSRLVTRSACGWSSFAATRSSKSSTNGR
jgi:hypothetical protein